MTGQLRGVLASCQDSGHSDQMPKAGRMSMMSILLATLAWGGACSTFPGEPADAGDVGTADAASVVPPTQGSPDAGTEPELPQDGSVAADASPPPFVEIVASRAGTALAFAVSGDKLVWTSAEGIRRCTLFSCDESTLVLRAGSLDAPGTFEGSLAYHGGVVYAAATYRLSAEEPSTQQLIRIGDDGSAQGPPLEEGRQDLGRLIADATGVYGASRQDVVLIGGTRVTDRFVSRWGSTPQTLFYERMTMRVFTPIPFDRANDVITYALSVGGAGTAFTLWTYTSDPPVKIATVPNALELGRGSTFTAVRVSTTSVLVCDGVACTPLPAPADGTTFTRLAARGDHVFVSQKTTGGRDSLLGCVVAGATVTCTRLPDTGLEAISSVRVFEDRLYALGTEPTDGGVARWSVRRLTPAL